MVREHRFLNNVSDILKTLSEHLPTDGENLESTEKLNGYEMQPDSPKHLLVETNTV